MTDEAPEVSASTSSDVVSLTTAGYKIVGDLIGTSSAWNFGSSYETYSEFITIKNLISQQVLCLSNKILSKESENLRLKSCDDEGNVSKVIEESDTMLDRVNTHIDQVLGPVQPAGSSAEQVVVAPVVTKVQMGSTIFFGAKNIPRPQLKFKDTIDNSDNVWMPIIKDKPNNIRPLALIPIYNDDKELIGYEHPYEMELEQYQPPPELIEICANPPFPKPVEETPLTLVDTPEKLAELVEHLRGVQFMGVDLEHHSYRTYQGFTCLIQISTDEGGDFIIDALELREHIHTLNVVFTDPRKIKIFHGASMDVLWLQRDFGVYVVGMFDTHQAVKMLGHSELSLKSLLQRYCSIYVDKKYQLADWRLRPLPQELIQYARVDTHYLVYAYRRLLHDLNTLGPAQLRAVFDNSRLLCLTTYSKEPLTDESHMPLYRRSNKAFSWRQLAALKLLYKYRDTSARELDESPGYLLPNHMLLMLAEVLPREVQGLYGCCHPTPPFVNQNVNTIHRMLLACRELPQEQPRAPAAAPAPAPPLPRPQRAKRVLDFTHAPEYRDSWPTLLRRAPAVHYSQHAAAAADADVLHHHQPVARPVSAGPQRVQPHFAPPFLRFRLYRALAEVEESRKKREKEAKVVALTSGNEMLQKEVLPQFQETKDSPDSPDPTSPVPASPAPQTTPPAPATPTTPAPATPTTPAPATTTKRPLEKIQKETPITPTAPSTSNVYKNVDYSRFQTKSVKKSKAKKRRYNK